MYPRSGILRRETAYKTWEPSAQRSLAAGEEVESFYFALFSECGEVARCPVGGFIESAVSFFVEQDEERRLSSATANFQRVLAVVLAVQSGGAFVFLEVLSSTAFSEGKPRVTGVCNPGERSVTISVVARTVTVSMPQELRSFQHLHCLASMRWSGSKGSALLLAAHVEDNHVPEGKTGGKEAGDLCCSLISIEMLRGKGGVHIRTWQTNTGESGYGGGKSGFPFHSGMPMLLEPTGINSVEYSVGAVRHAPLEPLCRCEAPALNVDHYLNASGARNSKDMEIVLFRSGDICLCRRAFLDGVHASAAGGTEEDCVKYQWLSTVQWPSFAEPEAVNALTILFSSASHNVCMIAMPCSKGRDSVPREGKCGVVNLKDEVLLLVTCRSTVIVMSVSGRVLWASDLCEDAVKEAAKVSGSGALEIPSLICCMLRPLASWAESFFAVLSATVASPPHVGGVDGACLQCVFLLLQVRWWPKGTADDCRPVASVCVTDTHHAAAYGQLIFDLAPLPCFECGVARLPSNVTMEETTMCSAELLYCSGCLLSSIACAVLFVTSGSGISLVARFFQLRGGGENLLDFRCVIDDEGRRNNTELFTQPTLLKFVGLPSDRRYSGILFISFLSGLTLVAGLYSHSGHGNRQWALQLLKTPAVAVAASGEVAPAPFVQLLQNVKSSNDEDSLCFVQDACGRWAVLHCERVRKKSHECWEAELGQEMLLQLDGLVDNLQRALHGGDEVVILSHGASGSFALVPG
uniref:WGS project CAEQ00000000 data, annotated contig 1762 n=1 Tax=Trypanosoma congolense (strain IL3000) TaxID=1068625 RepID=F9W8Q9_TRYCI|nr:unnamed protein product [Trypanosoma congolense IL3000]